MAIDKALYQAPLGMDALANEPDIEIEIEDPEEVNIRADGVEIEIRPGEEEGEFNANLAEQMDAGELSSLVGELLDDVKNDLSFFIGFKISVETHIFHKLPGPIGVFMKNNLTVRLIKGFYQNDHLSMSLIQVIQRHPIKR